MPRTPIAKRGQALPIVVGAIILLGGAAAILWWLAAAADRAGAGPGRSDIHEARRGGFDIVIPASGELVAQSQIEIKNRLNTDAIITEIVDEGAVVRRGDVLVRFNDDAIRTEVQEAEDEAINAQNELESATAELEIVRKTRESEVEKAQLAMEIAALELESWEHGAVVAQREELTLAVETAELDHARLLERFDASKRLYEQEFISLDEFKQDEIALVEARATLRLARLAIEVFEQYEYQKQRKQLESDLDQASKELARVISRQDATVRRAESDMDSKQRQLENRRVRLTEAREQFVLCTIYAPADGLVVYASSLEDLGHWDDDETIGVGVEVRSNEYIMVLPDITRMAADVKVNEALSGRIAPGQVATVICDAAPDRALSGAVQRIGVLAETGGRRDPYRRDYTVRVRLDGLNNLDLKPSMRCRADIKVETVVDALHVPIQAVHREGAATFVYVPESGGFAQQLVTLGRASEMYIEITGGLSAGDRVLMREPAAREIMRRLPPELVEAEDGAEEDEAGRDEFDERYDRDRDGDGDERSGGDERDERGGENDPPRERGGESVESSESSGQG